MSEGIEYKVSTVYEVYDKASHSLKEIGHSAEKTGHHVSELKEHLKLLAEGVGLYEAFKLGKEAIFGLNNELEKAKVKLGGVIALNTGASLEKAIGRAETSMAHFNEMSWQSGAAVQEIASVAATIQQPLMAAGMKIADIESLAHEAIRVGEAFGKTGDETAQNITRAVLMGTTRDMFMRSILQQQGVSMEAFQKMTQGQRSSAIFKMFTSKGAQEAADFASDKTFSGGLGDMMSHVMKLASTAGQPLFKMATDELQRMKKWIEANRSMLEGMAHTLGEKLVAGFTAVKNIAQAIWPLIKEMGSVMMDLISFAANHKDTLIALTKGLLVYKGASLAGGMVSSGLGAGKSFLDGIFGGLGGLKEIGTTFMAAKDGSASLASSFSTLLSTLPGVIGAFAKIAGVGYIAGSLMFGKTEEEKKRDEKAAEQLKTAADIANARKRVGELQRELQTFAPGADIMKTRFASPALQQWQDQLKELSGGLNQKEIDLLSKGLKEGFVQESVENNRRMLRLRPTDTSVGETNLGAHKAIYEQLGEIFKHKAVEAEEERMKMFGSALYDPSTWGSVAGKFFSETIQESNKEAEIESQAKPPVQNVNITIQQVTAKDPNRWLADMDDMVARRTRANTRAKRALKSSPQ